MTFSALYGLGAAVIYIISSGAPFIAQDHISLSSSSYGLFMLVAYAGPMQLAGGLLIAFLGLQSLRAGLQAGGRRNRSPRQNFFARPCV